MLIFSQKLETYIDNALREILLLSTKQFYVKGSFRRKIPYVTDIDVVNVVYPKINQQNIYEKVMSHIQKYIKRKDKSIRLVYVSCGVDNRFKLESGSKNEIDNIKQYLNDAEIEEVDTIMQKYTDDPERKLFFLNEFIWPLYKIRWTLSDVLEGEKILRGNLKVNFREQLEENNALLFQYFIMIGNTTMGADIVVQYAPTDAYVIYSNAADYNLKLANFSREYYYMLFPFRYYFRDNPKIIDELFEIIEKKFGLYKQLMVRIDSFHLLFVTHHLSYKDGVLLAQGIIDDLHHLPQPLETNIVEQFEKVIETDQKELHSAILLERIDVLLDVLYDEINMTVNGLSKGYFFRYLDMVPADLQKKYYLALK